MQLISIISTKGGVGKTTLAANLGAFAAVGCFTHLTTAG